MAELPIEALYVQVAAWATAAVAAVVGVAKFWVDNNTAQAQREREIAAAAQDLEWRQGEAAQAFLEKMEEDEEAGEAMAMLDWDGRDYSDGERTWRLSEAQIVHALRVGAPSYRRSEVYVRDAFDHLFWYFERIQHQIEIELIRLDHVVFPLAYLFARMNKNRDAFRSFLAGYDYKGTLELWDALEKRGLPALTHHEATETTPDD